MSFGLLFNDLIAYIFRYLGEHEKVILMMTFPNMFKQYSRHRFALVDVLDDLIKSQHMYSANRPDRGAGIYDVLLGGFAPSTVLDKLFTMEEFKYAVTDVELQCVIHDVYGYKIFESAYVCDYLKSISAPDILTDMVSYVLKMPKPQCYDYFIALLKYKDKMSVAAGIWTLADFIYRRNHHGRYDYPIFPTRKDLDELNRILSQLLGAMPYNRTVFTITIPMIYSGIANPI